MHKKKFVYLLGLLVIAVMLLSAAGCASKETAVEKSAGEYKIVLLLPGPIND